MEQHEKYKLKALRVHVERIMLLLNTISDTERRAEISTIICNLIINNTKYPAEGYGLLKVAEKMIDDHCEKFGSNTELNNTDEQGESDYES